MLHHLRVVSGDLMHCRKSRCRIMLGLFEILFFFFHMQVPKVDKMSPSERMCVCVFVLSGQLLICCSEAGTSLPRGHPCPVGGHAYRQGWHSSYLTSGCLHIKWWILGSCLAFTFPKEKKTPPQFHPGQLCRCCWDQCAPSHGLQGAIR